MPWYELGRADPDLWSGIEAIAGFGPRRHARAVDGVVGGGSGVLAGGLTLSANPNLSQRGSPANANVELVPGARLVVGSGVQGNPSLAPAEVRDCVAYQHAGHGWATTGSGFTFP
ncbi:MAG: hypothetical protein K0V04_26655 [Deltaproteobacteria bacterium]|nr:hypothetical protein [Deltaproteobacteria bacterium]